MADYPPVDDRDYPCRWYLGFRFLGGRGKSSAIPLVQYFDHDVLGFQEFRQRLEQDFFQRVDRLAFQRVGQFDSDSLDELGPLGVDHYISLSIARY